MSDGWEQGRSPTRACARCGLDLSPSNTGAYCTPCREEVSSLLYSPRGRGVLELKPWEKREKVAPEPRREKPVPAQLQEELNEAHRRLGLPSSPPNLAALDRRRHETIDALLDAWIGHERLGTHIISFRDQAHAAVTEALIDSTNCDEALNRVRQAFPGAPPLPEDAFLALCRQWKESRDRLLLDAGAEELVEAWLRHVPEEAINTVTKAVIESAHPDEARNRVRRAFRDAPPLPEDVFRALCQRWNESRDRLLLDAGAEELVQAWLGRAPRQAVNALRLEAHNAVFEALIDSTDSDEARQRVCERFPDAPPLPEDAFLAVWQVWNEGRDWNQLWRRCWGEAERLARNHVNRGKTRTFRRLYVEELFFDCMWYNRPLDQRQLNKHFEMMTNAAWDARCSLYEACRDLPPPRTFEALIRKAHRLQRGTGQPDDKYENFRRLVYDNTTRGERRRYSEIKYQPTKVMLGSDPRLRRTP